MKTLTKIAILVALIAFVSSCQKEQLPVPGNHATQQSAPSNQRTSGSHAGVGTPSAINGEEDTRADEIVGGGDDDRDGGGGKKEKKN
jgi:hypothetical protein